MDFVTTPERVQLMASSAENFVRHFSIGGASSMTGGVPRLGKDVPRWFGESIAFWDGDVPWITHGVFEFSGQMQTVEILSPRRGPVQVHIKTGELENVDPFIYARCIQAIGIPKGTGAGWRASP